MQDARTSAGTESGAVGQERWLRLVAAIERLSAARSLDEIVEIVRTSAGLIAEADGVTFVLRDGDRCHYVAEKAISPLWAGLRFPMTSCISGWCMLNKRTAVIPDVYADPRIPHDVYRPTFVNSLVMAPIRVEDPLAAIGAYWAEKRAPDPETVKMLETLARSASTAMANTQLFSSLAANEAQARQQLAELEVLYRTVPVGLGMFDRNLRRIRINDAFAALDGGPPQTYGEHPLGSESPKVGDRLNAICCEALFSGKTVGPAEISNAKSHDAGEPRTWLVYASPVATEGAVDRVTILALDISERKRSEEQIRRLLREVNHRSKNLLAAVQAMARLTVDPQEAAGFSERIRGLATSQDLLVKSEWRGANLEELVRSQLSHFAKLIGSRIALGGTRVVVSASAAQTLGMVLHELSANAGKYGALSGPAGDVRIEWALDRKAPDTNFVMSWTESNGPLVTEPGRKGFGSTVAFDLVRSNLQGEVDFEFAPTGVKWRLRCLAAKVLEEFDASSVQAQNPQDAGGHSQQKPKSAGGGRRGLDRFGDRKNIERCGF
ncbi:MAG: HWE histidine kinase domain-containing protein [Rhodomicrobium sp.]